MAKSILILIVLFVQVINGDIFQANDDSLCSLCEGKDYPHINCNHDHTLKCASTTPLTGGLFYAGSVVTITDSIKNQILEYHNNCRDKIASGELSNYLPAVKMPVVKWNDELAELAQLNVKNCIYTHDCHKTPNFEYSGQNIGYMSTTSPIPEPMAKTNGTMMSWFNEYQICTPEIIANYVRIPELGHYGHFTAMVTDRTDQIGCAILKYKRAGSSNTPKNSIYTVCNYSSTNIDEMPVYETGTTPATKCSNGVDMKYQNLCKTL